MEPAAVTVVVATRNRSASLAATLDRLRALPERPPVIVVDNASDDDTRQIARRHAVHLVRLDRNLGAAARTVGARRARTRHVAFCDDDSWWRPGSLSRAAALLDAHRRLGLLAGRVVLEPVGLDDPACAAMATSPLGREPDLPGPSVLGFVACGAVVRRDAFLAVGGFHERLGIGGEEALLAIDLARTGWGLAYVDDVVAHHAPAGRRDPAARRRVVERNRLWLAALRRPLGTAARCFGGTAARSLADADARAALLRALGGLPWIARERRPVSAALEGRLRLLET